MAAAALPKALNTAASTNVLQDAAAPTPAKQAMGDVGQAGTQDALARLNEAMKEIKALAVAPLLKKAVDALNRENFVQGGKWALKALDHDDRNGFGWEVDVKSGTALALLAPVLWTAGDLLAGPRLERVRRCANPECGWLFLDDSRAGKRRWCSMSSCGNRAKARRHYHKSREE